MIEKYYKFLGSDWANLLSPFLLSEEYSYISKTIKEQVKVGHEFAPNLTDIFNCFLECPLYKLHTIILAQDPYNTVYINNECVADGLAFSTRNKKHCPKQLDLIYQLIDKSVYEGYNYELTDTYDLRKWANQGILLLNANITVRLGYNNTHAQLWNNFIKYVIKKINDSKDGIGVILMGRHAQSFEHLFTNKTYNIFSCEHPAFATTVDNWVHADVFKRLVDFHKEKNNIEIKW